MRFVRVGEYQPDALDREIEIDSLRDIGLRLKRMDHLLASMRTDYPDDHEAFIANLMKKYHDLLLDSWKDASPVGLEELVADKPRLQEHSELVVAVVAYMMQMLSLPAGTKLTKHKVVNRNYFKLFSHIHYYNLLVLTETIGREKAIALYKKHFTTYILDNRDPDRKTVNNLQEVFEMDTKPTGKRPEPWVIVRGMIADGKYAYRNDNCLWIEAIEDLPDNELKYYVCCYGDYEWAKIYHDSIVLTMEHTIAQGDPYCSRVMHDTRVDWDLRHPPKSFWDSISAEKD